MMIDIATDPQDEMYANTRMDIVRRRLGTALLLLLQELRADDLRRGTFIGKGMDGAAVIETADKAQRAAEEHAQIFVQPAEEIERKKQLDADVAAVRKELRW